MQKTKLLELLRTLRKEEFRRLYKFVKSPYFNTNQGVVKLYEYLRPHYPEFKSAKLKKEEVFKYIYPDETYLDTRIRTLISFLKHLVEDYLIELELQEDTTTRERALIAALGRRNCYAFFEEHSEKLIQNLEKVERPIGDIDGTLGHLQELQKNIYFHPLTSKNHAQLRLAESMRHLDIEYYSQKLLHICEMLSRTFYLSESPNLAFSDVLLDEVQKQYGELPYFRLMLEIKALFSQNDSKLFFSCKDIFFETIEKLSWNVQSSVLGYLLNYAIFQANRGNAEFTREIFHLYQKGLEFDLLENQGKMTDYTFTNIAVNAAFLEEFDWAFNFVDTYESHLDEQVRDDAKMLALAYIYFYKKDFDEVVSLLNAGRFKNNLHLLRARTLGLRAYFELFLEDDRYFEFLESSIQSFEKYLRREQFIAKSKSKVYLNFTSYLKKLSRLYVDQKLKNYKKVDLIQQIKSVDQMVAKSWLIGKIDQMMK